MEDIGKIKAELRKRFAEQNLDNEYINAAGEAIERTVLQSREFAEAKTVFCYVSIGNEPTTAGIIRKALADGKKLCVPKCISRTQMIAVEIDSPEVLRPGRMGISEPESSSPTDSREIDLAIVPCVSATKQGDRLGHGAGFYDRFLADCRAAKVCLCFRKRLSDSLPCTETDIKMDTVVSE